MADSPNGPTEATANDSAKVPNNGLWIGMSFALATVLLIALAIIGFEMHDVKPDCGISYGVWSIFLVFKRSEFSETFSA